MEQDPPATNQLNPYASPVSPDRVEFQSAPEANFLRILNAGLRLYTNNLLPIAAITLLVWTPLEIFQAYMEYFVFDADDLRTTFRFHRALESFFGIIATAGVISIETAAMRGQRLSVWEGLSQGFLAWPKMFWTHIIMGLFLVFAFLALIIPGIYFLFRLTLIEQVVVIERTSGVEGLKRAYHLTQNRSWLMAGLMVGSYFPLMLIAFGMSVPLVLFPEIDQWLVSAAIALVIAVLMQIPTSLFVAAYFACRESTVAVAQLPVDTTYADSPRPAES